MPDPMTVCYEGPPRAERVEVITSVQRRRRWSTGEKVRIVEETYLPGNSVSAITGLPSSAAICLCKLLFTISLLFPNLLFARWLRATTQLTTARILSFEPQTCESTTHP